MKRFVLIVLLAGGFFYLGQMGKRYLGISTNYSQSDFGAAPAFKLIDSNGEAFSSEELRGKYYLLSFFFSSCQGPCPVLLSRLQATHKDFAKSPNFTLLSVSVDPKRDTPEVLNTYSKSFRSDPSAWKFLTGSVEDIRNLIENGYSKFPETPDSHTTHLFLVNPDGRVEDIFRGSSEPEFERLKNTLNSLL